jgi:pyocin large subunit-like protein
VNWNRVLQTVSVPVGVALAVVVLAIFWMGPAPSGAGMPAAMETTAAEATAASAATYDEPIWTGGEENAEHHWQKHGGEFPQFATREAYVAGAHAFIDHPPPGTLTKRRDNGDTLFYDPGSNTFAVRAPGGAPRTFFRPDSGRAYWERQ